MLALLSISSANVAPTASCLTRSSICGTPSSSSENASRVNALHEPPVLVLDRGFEQHARHLGLFDDVEGLEDDAIADVAAERVGDLHRDFPALERVLVRPLHGVGRAIDIGLEQLLSTKKRTGPRRRRRRCRICATMRMLPDEAACGRAAR